MPQDFPCLIFKSLWSFLKFKVSYKFYLRTKLKKLVSKISSFKRYLKLKIFYCDKLKARDLLHLRKIFCFNFISRRRTTDGLSGLGTKKELKVDGKCCIRVVRDATFDLNL